MSDWKRSAPTQTQLPISFVKRKWNRKWNLHKKAEFCPPSLFGWPNPSTERVFIAERNWFELNRLLPCLRTQPLALLTYVWRSRNLTARLHLKHVCSLPTCKTLATVSRDVFLASCWSKSALGWKRVSWFVDTPKRQKVWLSLFRI